MRAATARTERVVRLVECDADDLPATVATTSDDERADAETLLRLSIELGRDEQLIARHRLAELAGQIAELKGGA